MSLFHPMPRRPDGSLVVDWSRLKRLARLWSRRGHYDDFPEDGYRTYCRAIGATPTKAHKVPR